MPFNPLPLPPDDSSVVPAALSPTELDPALVGPAPVEPAILRPGPLEPAVLHPELSDCPFNMLFKDEESLEAVVDSMLEADVDGGLDRETEVPFVAEVDGLLEANVLELFEVEGSIEEKVVEAEEVVAIAEYRKDLSKLQKMRLRHANTFFIGAKEILLC